MNVNLHIERLVVDPDIVAAGEGERLGGALRSELRRLLAKRGIPVTQSVALPSLRAGPLRIDAGAGAQVVGRGVARSIHGSLCR